MGQFRGPLQEDPKSENNKDNLKHMVRPRRKGEEE